MKAVVPFYPHTRRNTVLGLCVVQFRKTVLYAEAAEEDASW